MIFSVLVVVFFAFVYCVVARELYKSSTTILILPQEVPEDYIKSTVTYSVEERLSTIQQQVLSRPRLLKIIQSFDLFPELRDKVPQETLLEKMIERTNIELKGESREKNAFTIEYLHEDPRIAMLVVSDLASLFIEDNLKLRVGQAVGTAEFLDTQVQAVKKELDRKDRKIKVYKTKHMGELPEQMASNLGMLTRYQEELNSISDSIRSAEDRKLLLDTQISALKSRSGLREEEVKTDENIDLFQMSRKMSLAAEIAKKKEELSKLRITYTDSNPTTKKLIDEIGKLEDAYNDTSSEANLTEQNGNTVESSTYIAPESEGIISHLTDLIQRRKEVELNIKKLHEAKEDVLKSIEVYSKRVENAPKRELELKELLRDYNNLKVTFEGLLQKKINADMSQDMEKRKKGEQFKILDPAFFPEKPFKPERIKIMLLAFMVSITLGVWGAIFCERMDKSIKTPDEFREIYGLPVLVTLPEIITEVGKKKMIQRRVMLAGGLILYVVAVITFVFVYSDKIRLILRI